MTRPSVILPLGFLSLVALACEYPTFEYSECDLEFANSCGKGKKCALVEPSTGKVACVTPGLRQAWEQCTVDADCVSGTLCDPRYLVCKPLCKTAANCIYDRTVRDGDQAFSGQVKGECIAPELPDGTRAPLTVKHCTAACEPISAAPCGLETGATCFRRNETQLDCGDTGGKLAGSECKAQIDCAAGLVCVATKTTDGMGNEKTNPARCRDWCDRAKQDCSNPGEVCQSLKLYYELGTKLVEYGACL
ncbi:MAG: hypothetical protein FJ096_13475 [Deltaproteobacteria bacterium]|nr:hypothetical protein [Deltaproteobacteria bacterium]